MKNTEQKNSMFYGASPIIFELARKLRNNMTDAEMVLWGMLKTYFPELKFRRQHPVSSYIADFYCHSHKLILELDGSIHHLPDVRENDKLRQQDLEELGIKVLRFTNKELAKKPDMLLEIIKKNLKSL